MLMMVWTLNACNEILSINGISNVTHGDKWMRWIAPSIASRIITKWSAQLYLTKSSFFIYAFNTRHISLICEGSLCWSLSHANIWKKLCAQINKKTDEKETTVDDWLGSLSVVGSVLYSIAFHSYSKYAL